jgi:glycosyltransferase involved in cell wall biosynthesis
VQLVVVSTYPPRRCGLAAFAADLRAALTQVVPDWPVRVCAVDRAGLSYGPEVVEVIRQDCPDDYRRAAYNLAAGGVDLVVIQHEYGIFGGPDGAYVLDLADGLRGSGVPYVVTLHTVLTVPTSGQAATLAELCSGAALVTGFTATARALAAETNVADPHRFAVVPHGAPDTLRAASYDADLLRPAVRDTLAGMGEARMLATFGLIGPSKGLETAIAALPAVIARHPDVRYVIAGTTHPEVARHGDDTYRRALAGLARRLGVRDHVRFIPVFLTEPELAALLARTDVFLTPYRSPEQICSGALTFALAAGTPVVSTGYRYAVDVVTPPDRPAAGVLTPFDNPAAFADGILALLDDPDRLATARDSAWELGSGLLWPSVAERFARVFVQAARAPRVVAARAGPARHLETLTDEIGIIQFARGTAPDPDSGYCVDDAARLAIVAAGLATTPRPLPGQIEAELPRRWLAAALRLIEAALTVDGMHNQMGYDGVWLDSPHSGDHVGRACWALGVVASASLPPDLKAQARLLLDAVLPLLAELASPRPRAYAVLGLARLDTPDGQATATLREVALGLTADVGDEHGWHWFEPVLTYDNARLPQALLAAGESLHEPFMIGTGLSTLDWYLTQVGLHGETPMLRLVGNRWRHRDIPRQHGEGDEQPLDAAATVEALVQAYRVTGDRRYANLARRAFMWFHGANRAGAALFDPATGGCRDGLSGAAANPNQGAESTLAYYQALLALSHAALSQPAQRPSAVLVARGLGGRRPAPVMRRERG